MPPSPQPSLLARGAVGFWFLGLGALGLLRGAMRAFRHGPFAADTITWVWLIGSAILVLVGVLAIARAARRRREDDTA